MIAGLLHAIAWLVARLPPRWLPALGAFVGFVARVLVRYRRGHVLEAMERAGLREPRSTARALYRRLGEGLAELLWLGGRAKVTTGHIEVTGGHIEVTSGHIERAPEHFWARAVPSFGARPARGALPGPAPAEGLGLGRATGSQCPSAIALAERRHGAGPNVILDEAAHAILGEAVARGPVVIFASHTGNWELAAAAAAEALRPLDKELFVVAKTQRVSAVDAFCMRLRSALGVRVIAPNGAFREAMRVLARGDVVVLPIDQVPDRAAHALTVSFLGAPALVDRAPATLAYRAKATVLVAGTARTDEGLTVRVLDMIAPSEDRAFIAEATARATKALEAFVRENPADWLWLHRRWKALPVARRTGTAASLGFSENPS